MESSIIQAIRKGYFTQLRYLIQLGADVDERNEKGQTTLMLCALLDSEKWGVSLARTLLENGANASYLDRKSMNVIHYACIYERPELLQTYLSALDCDLNQRDAFGNTPLIYATRSGNVRTSQLLVRALKRYGLSVDVANTKGFTPLILAWKQRHLLCAKLLIEEGEADTKARDPKNRTAEQWEREALAKLEKLDINNENNSTPLSHKQSNSKRVRSVNRSRDITIARCDSAPLLYSRRPKEQNGLRGGKTHGNQQGNRITRENLIRSASMSNLRNIPEYVFQVKPADCFETRNESTQRDSPTAYSNSKHGRGKNGENWRNEVKRLFHELEFQYSLSYRKAAKPEEPPPQSPVTLGMIDAVYGEADRGQTGACSRLSGRSSRLSRAPSMANLKKRQSSAKLGRTVGQVTMIRSMLHTDSSSTESLARPQQQKLNRRRSELKVDRSETGRPSSRASNVSAHETERRIMKEVDETKAK